VKPHWKLNTREVANKRAREAVRKNLWGGLCEFTLAGRTNMTTNSALNMNYVINDLLTIRSARG
jgi:hypothetical protein